MNSRSHSRDNVFGTFFPFFSQALYKNLLRQCEKLPADASKFYRQSVRKEFDQHRDEVHVNLTFS
jgi:hypothetical protein